MKSIDESSGVIRRNHKNNIKFGECSKCKILNRLFHLAESNRDYWLITELFVSLHGNKDYCKYAYE